MIKINTLKEFKDVLDIYYLDGDGKVYSTHLKDYMRDTNNGRGYMYYKLKLKGVRKWINAYTHRLIAVAYIPNPFNKLEVNHIDENKSNNSIDNLEWVTRRENVNHGTGIERQVELRGFRVYVYDFALDFVGEYVSLSEATRDILGARDTRVLNNRASDYYFLDKPIEEVDIKRLNRFKFKTLVLEDTLNNVKTIYPNHKSLSEKFPTINITDAINKKWLVKNRYRISILDFKTLKDSPNLYEKKV